MDNRTEIREFLASRRARITPQQTGLPSYGGTRRVKGLRRGEVAELAAVSIEYYTRLERGNLEGVSEDVLQVGESSLYPALQRLLLRGWVRAEWGASENNRRARYYTLTPAGRKQLAVERHEFDRLILAIHKVLNTA